MAIPVSDTIYFLEARQRHHDGTGKWGAWYMRDQWFANYRAARRERDRLNDEADTSWECRVVAYSRGRVYKKGTTEDVVR